ncbi:MAG: hypothetical protein OES38_01640 [Gammaproteobacteria bacterium]|nr:hypothetical protein [Gammaproteobacteria bacterium]
MTGTTDMTDMTAMTGTIDAMTTGAMIATRAAVTAERTGPIPARSGAPGSATDYFDERSKTGSLPTTKV